MLFLTPHWELQLGRVNRRFGGSTPGSPCPHVQVSLIETKKSNCYRQIGQHHKCNPFTISLPSQSLCFLLNGLTANKADYYSVIWIKSICSFSSGYILLANIRHTVAALLEYFSHICIFWKVTTLSSYYLNL